MLLVIEMSAAVENGKEGVIVVGVANERGRLPSAICLRHSSAESFVFVNIIVA